MNRPASRRAVGPPDIRHVVIAAALALGPCISWAVDDFEFRPLSDEETTQLASALQIQAAKLGLDLSTLEGNWKRHTDPARGSLAWTAQAFVYTPIVHDASGLCSHLDYRYERKDSGEWRQARAPLPIAWLDKAGVCESQHSSAWSTLVGAPPPAAVIVRVMRAKDALLAQALKLPLHGPCTGVITPSARLSSFKTDLTEWPHGTAPGMVTITFRVFREFYEPGLHVLVRVEQDPPAVVATRCWGPD